MSVEQNKEVFRRVIDEVFTQGNYAVIPELFEPDFIEHQFGLKPTFAGLEETVRFLHSTFPDYTLTIEDMVAVNDMVWGRMTSRGTNSVGFMGPPNGKRFEITVFDQVRIRDGKIVEHWGSPDRFAQLIQLGLLPKPQAA